MKAWLNTRLGWLDNQNAVGGIIYRPPVFSQNGGSVCVELSVGDDAIHWDAPIRI
jgi:hypothetical protein